MIDFDTFNAAWAILEDRFKREFSAPTRRLYLECLSAALTTAEFQEACRIVFARNTYFPTPEEIISAVKDDSAVPLDQWELCERLMNGEDHVEERLNATGRKAVNLLGGVRVLQNTPIDRLPFVRNEFLRIFQTLTDGPPGARSITGPEVTPDSRRIVGEVMSKSNQIPEAQT